MAVITATVQNVITRNAVIQGEVDGKKTSVKYKQCSFQLIFVKDLGQVQCLKRMDLITMFKFYHFPNGLLFPLVKVADVLHFPMLHCQIEKSAEICWTSHHYEREIFSEAHLRTLFQLLTSLMKFPEKINQKR